MLAKAGIRTEARLRKLGSVAAYLAVQRVWPAASLNLLWALEGAVTGRDWREVAKRDRLDLLTRLEAAQESRPARRRTGPKR
jgi:DNA transformation protein